MKTIHFLDIPKNSGGISIQETVFSESERYYQHGHDFYEILFVTDGQLIHTINGQSLHMAKNMMYFIRPGDVHAFRRSSKSQRASLVNIAFDEPLFKKLCPDSEILGILRPMVRLASVEINFLLYQIAQIRQTDMNDSSIVYSINCAVILSAVSIILTQSRLPAELPSPWLEKCIALMGTDENFLLGMKGLVELSGVSQEHLTRQMKKHYGVTPTKLINQHKLEYACKQLLNKNTDITTIAMNSGFSSLSYFNRVFRSVYGCTPSEYNKNQGLFGLAIKKGKEELEE